MLLTPKCKTLYLTSFSWGLRRSQLVCVDGDVNQSQLVLIKAASLKSTLTNKLSQVPDDGAMALNLGLIIFGLQALTLHQKTNFAGCIASANQRDRAASRRSVTELDGPSFTTLPGQNFNAFILKPERLRYLPNINKNYSYNKNRLR